MSNLCRPFVAMSLCLVVACGGPPRATPEVPAAAAPPVTLSQAPRLPVSLNDVMVALVNEAADPLWVAAWKQHPRRTVTGVNSNDAPINWNLLVHSLPIQVLARWT